MLVGCDNPNDEAVKVVLDHRRWMMEAVRVERVIFFCDVTNFLMTKVHVYYNISG